MIIRGNTVGTTMPRANWNQDDPKKGDYIIGKEAVDEAIATARKNADNAQATADNAQTTADNAQATADEAQALAINAQGKYISKKVTLPAASWIFDTSSQKSQIVEVDGVTESNDIDIAPEPESHAAYCDAGVFCATQANGKLGFCCANFPDVNLTVNIRIWN